MTGFLIGGAIGTINGALSLMDPVGAFFVVLILEFLVRLRQPISSYGEFDFVLSLIDLARIGMLYGLLMEGFKLL